MRLIEIGNDNKDLIELNRGVKICNLMFGTTQLWKQKSIKISNLSFLINVIKITLKSRQRKTNNTMDDRKFV